MCGCGKITCENAAKHPLSMLARNGVTDATTDVDRVRHWWHMRPDANIGLHCSGLVVLDVDPRHGGDASLAALEDEHDVLPETWTVCSGSGGRHLYFSAPDSTEIRNNSDGGLAAGIDIRTRGGYVLAPPSRHISGGFYTWLVDPDEAMLRTPAYVADRGPGQTPHNATCGLAQAGPRWPRCWIARATAGG
jgi:hypothetical protein